jgi:hypothetical protein
MDEIHRGICLKYAPRVKARLTQETAVKPMHSMDTREMAQVIEGLFREMWEYGIPVDGQVFVAKSLLDWQTWRAGEPDACLDDTYTGIEDYRDRVPYCEACGLVKGVEIAHIVGSGAGGPLEAWNVLHLCINCHRVIVHMKGMEKFTHLYPHLRAKIDNAKAREGKRPIQDPVQEPELELF